MRIITGIYKGRHFDIPRTFKARPTTDFAKENIFNVLTQHVDLCEAEALDLFSGTGSISLELLSRGCRQVVSVELDRDHHRFICNCVNSLNPAAGGKVVPLRADVFRFLKSCHRQFDFIFADPPYILQQIPALPDLVFEKGLLKDNGLFVLEHGKDHNFASHPHFIDHRAYGSVNFSLFR